MKTEIVNSFKGLNFSGDEDSWFDLWHTHSELKENAELSWKERAASLNRLVGLYHHFRQRLEGFHRPYQLWIEVWEKDPLDDAVYIHTPNPNADNFPVKMEATAALDIKDPKLKEWVDRQGLDKISIKTADDTLTILFDPTVGIPVVT